MRKLGLLLGIVVVRTALAQSADCDGNGVLNSNDFQCFSNAYAVAQGLPAAQQVTSYANCDGSTVAPVLTANDFQCFANRYAAQAHPNPPVSGWTSFPLPSGARVYYASAAGTGNGSTPSTPGGLTAGLAGLRNGVGDQLLLKCGDTFNLSDQITLTKSANSTTSYMLIGSYGTGPRPVIITPSHGIYGGNNSGQHNGLAIVGLELHPASITQGSSGIVLLSTAGNAWDDVLIEDCYIHGYSTGIVAQVLVDGRVFERMKIRRSVIADNDNNGGGHAQGIFLGGASDWLIEECVIDNNARSKSNMFCHNLYCHEWSKKGKFLGNISSRACSHGGQQRPGGDAINNLFLQNPINFYQGANSLIAGNTVNKFQYNVALDSRNINSVDVRALGYVLAGTGASVVSNNIAAYQRLGTANTIGFDLDGFHGSVSGNCVYDWSSTVTPVWGEGYKWESGTVVTSFSSNKGWMVTGGRAVSDGGPSSYSANWYYSTTSPALTWNGGSDPGANMANPGPKLGNIGDYLDSINVARGSDPLLTFLTKARANSKLNWDVRFTASNTNTFIRGVFGVAQPAQP